jgi:hypothetical protein
VRTERASVENKLDTMVWYVLRHEETTVEVDEMREDRSVGNDEGQES